MRGRASARSPGAGVTVGMNPFNLSNPTGAVHHLFVIRRTRGATPLASALRERGIGTLVHYPIPLHLQPAFAELGGRAGDFPVAERAAGEILSIPLYPEMTDAQADTVIGAIRRPRRGCAERARTGRPRRARPLRLARRCSSPGCGGRTATRFSLDEALFALVAVSVFTSWSATPARAEGGAFSQ